MEDRFRMIGAGIPYMFPCGFCSKVYMCVISCSKRDARVMRVVPDTRRFTRLAQVGAREDRRSEPRGKTEEDGGERYSRMLYGWLSKIRVPFWVLNIIRHLLFRVPQKGPEF